MDDLQLSNYINTLMQAEIAPAIPFTVAAEQSRDFALSVLDRFRNPYIDHQWLSITMQYSSKMRSR